MAGCRRLLKKRLSEITTDMAQHDCDDGLLLDQLTRLAAEVESHISHSQFRFGAAHAYHTIVNQRIADIREVKIQGVQTIGEFLSKRLQPAITTCQSTAKRFKTTKTVIMNTKVCESSRITTSHLRANNSITSKVATYLCSTGYFFASWHDNRVRCDNGFTDQFI
jgi:uncharacterized membrane-anchored protein